MTDQHTSQASDDDAAGDALSSVELLDLAVADRRLSIEAARNIRRWLEDEGFEPYRDEIRRHLSNGLWNELERAFWRVIPFGTAGRRGRMYPIGTNTINQRTIGESAQGLANYLRQLHGDRGDLRCAIGYDTRHRSREFALLCAEIMAAAGFHVFFLNAFRSTPALAMTVRHNGCTCGIMISASHNPPADNAIKVFWDHGGQVLPPHDAGIIACVDAARQLVRTDFATALEAGQIEACETEMDGVYHDAVLKAGFPATAVRATLKLLYSPLHGVGLTSVLPILRRAGFTSTSIYPPHAEPDGDFPNVPNHVANPEVASVFDCLIQHAREVGSDLVVASDPDADRIGCAAPLVPGGQAWLVLTGNQIGVILAEYVLRRMQQQGSLSPDHYVVKTLVTSDMVRRVADAYGVATCGDLLTGCKWIGAVIDQRGPERFVFGFEEAHGYLFGTYGRDKDAGIAALLLAELSAELKRDGRTLHQHLDQLSVRFGCYRERAVARTLPGAEGMREMQAIMARIRKSPPQTVGGLNYVATRDYLTLETRMAGGERLPLRSLQGGCPTSDLMILGFDREGYHAAVRPSGTEPKIKFYLFARQNADQTTRESLPETKQCLDDQLEAMARDLLAY